MKRNTPKEKVYTAEGAVASSITPIEQLRRSVLACLLWEKNFYDSGEEVGARIKRLVPMCNAIDVVMLAVEAREQQHLRHVPLLLVRELARSPTRHHVAETLSRVIQRADELAEFLAIYWAEGRRPLAKQVKMGLADAFQKFSEYELAKYNRDGAIKLRDVLFLVHAKPKDEAQAEVWKRLAEGELKTPDTWEVALSSGADKKEAWERLLREGKLGYLALIRNLRNMEEAKVEQKLIRAALKEGKGAEKVLPFRFLAAAKAAPRYEPELDAALLISLAQRPKLPGKTIVVIDVSGSMYGGMMSARSDMTRAHAASALGAIMREMCEEVAIYATAGDDYARKHKTQLVPARRGIALADAIYKLCQPLGGGGIFLKQVMDFLAEKEGEADRVIVITDEQDCGIDSDDRPGSARLLGRKANYIINVAVEKNGIAYEKWTHINGFSEAVVQYIAAMEV